MSSMKRSKLKTKLTQAVLDFDYDHERILMGGNFDKQLSEFIDITSSLLYERYKGLVRIEHGREYLDKIDEDEDKCNSCKHEHRMSYSSAPCNSCFFKDKFEDKFEEKGQ